MRFAVETWDPEYGSAVADTTLTESSEPTRIDAEVAVESWAPRAIPASVVAPPALLFVDGVQRVEARVWVHGAGPRPFPGGGSAVHQGICASYAAGVVRCDGRAELVAAEVRRALFCSAPDAQPVRTRHGEFRLVAVAGDSYEALAPAIRQKMGDLEVAVAQTVAADPAEPVLVDGPLRQHRLLPAAVGYIKSHHASYGPPVVLATVADLDVGQRTPLFVVGERFCRWSWYVRLPGERAHPLSGVVRCEASSELPLDGAVALADRVTAALPRFASRPHKDARAPQNLYPIAGLERSLRRRLGDPALIHRALRQAAAASAAA